MCRSLESLGLDTVGVRSQVCSLEADVLTTLRYRDGLIQESGTERSWCKLPSFLASSASVKHVRLYSADEPKEGETL